MLGRGEGGARGGRDGSVVVRLSVVMEDREDEGVAVIRGAEGRRCPRCRTILLRLSMSMNAGRERKLDALQR